MASVIPMLERCFERQWAGLPPEVHLWHESEREPTFWPLTPAGIAGPAGYILWHIEHPNYSYCAPGDILISIKID